MASRVRFESAATSGCVVVSMWRSLNKIVVSLRAVAMPVVECNAGGFSNCLLVTAACHRLAASLYQWSSAGCIICCLSALK